MKGRYTLTICKVKEQGSMGFRARCKGLQLRFNWKLMQSWKRSSEFGCRAGKRARSQL